MIISFNSVPDNETCECPLCKNQHITKQPISIATVEFPMKLYSIAEELNIASILWNPSRHNIIVGSDGINPLTNCIHTVVNLLNHATGEKYTLLNDLYIRLNNYQGYCQAFKASKIQTS